MHSPSYDGLKDTQMNDNGRRTCSYTGDLWKRDCSPRSVKRMSPRISELDIFLNREFTSFRCFLYCLAQARSGHNKRNYRFLCAVRIWKLLVKMPQVYAQSCCVPHPHYHPVYDGRGCQGYVVHAWARTLHPGHSAALLTRHHPSGHPSRDRERRTFTKTARHPSGHPSRHPERRTFTKIALHPSGHPS